MIEISQFSGDYRWLSNFYIEPDGTHVEGEYQSSKCLDPKDKEKFIGLTPGQCKKLGKTISIRLDWDIIKNDIMYQLVRKKFTEHAGLTEKLLSTGDSILIEGNNWNDTYWGICNGIGSNHLGKILMMIRNELVFHPFFS